MEGLKIRQGTVYEEINSKKRIMLINHNPMALQSLIICSEGPDKPFDIAHPEIISIDQIIQMRNSGNYRELGDIPHEALEGAVNAIAEANALPENETKLLKSVLN